MRLTILPYSFVAVLGIIVSTMAQVREIRPLEAAMKPAEREIKRGETHSYNVVLSAGQYLRVVARQKGIDIKLSLHGFQGEKLVEVDAANYVIDSIFDFTPQPVFASASEVETLSFQSKTSGRYRLDVRTVRPAAAAGRYVLKIEDLRAVTNHDRKRIAAQNIFGEAERLRGQRTPESLRRAIGKFKEALNLWRGTGNLIERSHTLDKLALCHFHLDEKQKAIEWFGQSLLIWREAAGQREEAYVLGNIGDVYRLRRDLKTFDFLNHALRLWQEDGDKIQEVLAHLKSNLAHKGLGEQHRAAFHFDEALRLSRALGDKRFEACLLIYLGWGHDHSEGRRRALDYLGQALEICRTADDPICEATVLVALGDAYEFMGQPTKALDYYNQVFRLTRRWGDHVHEIFALIHTGEVYFYQSNYQKAIDYFTEALSPSRTSGNHWGEAYALYSLGRVHEVLGEHENALEYYEQSLPHWRVIGDYDGVAYALNQIALILDARGQNERALGMLDEALKADAVCQRLLRRSPDPGQYRHAVRVQRRASEGTRPS